MALEVVTVQAGGQTYSTWTEVTVEAGAAHAARSFSIIASEPNQQIADAWPLTPGTACKVMASGDLLVDGYVDDYAPEFGADYHRAVISGRSKSKDLIDSSAVHKTGEWKKKTIKDIASDLAKPFGVTVDSDLSNMEPIPVWRLAPGATVFQEIEEMARQARALIVGTADGNIKLTRADKFKLHSGAIQEGVNIIVGSAQLSERGRHSEVHARGQKGLGSGKSAHRLEYVARDPTVERHRPKIFLGEGDMDDQRLEARGKWEVSRAAGWSTTATLKVRGWRDDSGELWNPEKLVFVESRKLKLSQVMAIHKLRFLQNDSGTTTTLSLVDPQALGGRKSKGSSNSVWESPNE